MTYRLPEGIKPYIDMLGPNYIRIPGQAFSGRQTMMLETAVHAAKLKIFAAGHGFPRISFEHMDIRFYPGDGNKIAFCFGVPVGMNQVSEVVYMGEVKGDQEGWLRSMGLIREQTVH